MDGGRGLPRGQGLLGRTSAVRSAIAVLLISLALAPIGPIRLTLPPAMAQPLEPDTCQGDERISFAPAEPLAGEELLVAVTSSRQHRGVWLAGAEHTAHLRDDSGQSGWVWTWTLTPRFPGPLRLRFFVDSTTLCAESTIQIGPSAHPAASEPSGPTVIFQPRRSRSGSENHNGNDNGSSNDNSSKASGRPPQPPQISAIDPSVTCQGGLLTISGSSFGSDRVDADGKVVVSGADVQDFLSWKDRTIVVLVPNGAKTGSGRDLYVINSLGYAHATVTVGAGPC